MHVVHLIGLLTVGAEHHRQLASDFVDAVAGDPDECRIDLDDLAGGIGDDDGRRGMVEHGRRAAQCRLGLALFADIPANAQGSIEPVVLVGDQHHPQLDRDRPAIGRETVEIQGLRLQGLPQLSQFNRAGRSITHPPHQVIEARRLARLGHHSIQAMLRRPLRAVAKHGLHRRADVVDAQRTVGGEDHIAQATGEHPVAAFAITQGMAVFHVRSDIPGHANQALHLPLLIARQDLFSHAEPMPFAVTVAPAQ